MNDIMVINNVEYDISTILTLEDAETFLQKIEALKSLLKIAKKWHEYACKYCAMEAATYVRISELGFSAQIEKRSIRNIIEWLDGVSTEDKKRYVEECANGITIQELYKREFVQPQKIKAAMETLEHHTEKIIDDFKINGKVSINDYRFYLDTPKKVLSPQIIEDHIDGVRDKLRQAGGYGTGDDSGTYVTVEKAGVLIEDTIHTRYISIIRDVQKLQTLIRESGYEYKNPVKIQRAFNTSDKLSEISIINLMFCLFGLAEPLLSYDSDVSDLRTIDAVLNGLGYSIEKILFLLCRNIGEINRFFDFSPEKILFLQGMLQIINEEDRKEDGYAELVKHLREKQNKEREENDRIRRLMQGDDNAN